MKKYLKVIIISLLQLFMFYIFPLFAGPTDAIGMVFLIIVVTFALSLILGIISKSSVRYLYPLAVALLFLPSVLIYYNHTAIVHASWYFVISTIGILLGTVINIVDRLVRKK